MGSNVSKSFQASKINLNNKNEKSELTKTKWEADLKRHPKPPRKRKREIYNPDNYKSINEYIRNTPTKLLHSDVKHLVEYLTKFCWDDLAKAHSLFYWLTSEAVFVRRHENSRKYSAIWYLNKILNGHGNFSHFFNILCWHADIPCIIIGGLTKNSAYKIGFPFVTKDMEAHWNAVYVKEDWYLASIQWACMYTTPTKDWGRITVVSEKQFLSIQKGNTNLEEANTNRRIPEKSKATRERFHHVNGYYFLTDPDELIWTHYPNDEKWQLLDKPVSISEFLKHFYVREQFFILNMTLTENSYTDCVLSVNDFRQIQIEFGLPPKHHKIYRFKYNLSPVMKDSHEHFRQMGNYEVRDNKFLLSLHFSSDGIYRLDIFGSKNQNCEFFLMCSYIIKCSNIEEEPELPSKFCLGYSSGLKGFKRKLLTHDCRIKLPFPIERDASIRHVLSRKGQKLEGCSLLRMTDGEDSGGDFITIITELRLPEVGEYSLKLYQNRKTEEKELYDYCIVYTKEADKSGLLLEDKNIKETIECQERQIVVLSHPGSFIQTNMDFLQLIFRSEYRLTCTLIPTNLKIRLELNPTVSYNTATKEYLFKVDIPEFGDYIMNIFAELNKEEVSPKFYQFHSYKIRKHNSDQFSISEFCQDRISSTYIAGTFETFQSEINIYQKTFMKETLLVLQHQRETTMGRNIVNVFDWGEESVIQVLLSQVGDYLLSLLTKDSKTGLIKKVTRYLLRRHHDRNNQHGDLSNENEFKNGENEVKMTNDFQNLRKIKEEFGEEERGDEEGKVKIEEEEKEDVEVEEKEEDEEKEREQKRLKEEERKREEQREEEIERLKQREEIIKERKREEEKQEDVDEEEGREREEGEEKEGGREKEEEREEKIEEIERIKEREEKIEEITIEREKEKEENRLQTNEFILIENDIRIIKRNDAKNPREKNSHENKSPFNDDDKIDGFFVGNYYTDKKPENNNNTQQNEYEKSSKPALLSIDKEKQKKPTSNYEELIKMSESMEANTKVNDYNMTTIEISRPSLAKEMKRKTICQGGINEPEANIFSDHILLRELEFAMNKQNFELLQLSIDRSEKHLKGSIVTRAKNMLEILRAKRVLAQAFEAQDKELLASALDEARRININGELNEDISLAQKLYSRLFEIKELQSIIRSFDNRTISELKSYISPPKEMILLMKSVFLILNEDENNLKDWKAIRLLMGNREKPFIRRIVCWKPESVSLESVKAAEKNLALLERTNISCVSEIAKVLFTWVRKMIEEAKKERSQY